MSRLKIIYDILPVLEDGVLLAVFHHVVRECLKRDSINPEYLSDYPLSIAQQQITGSAEERFTIKKEK